MYNLLVESYNNDPNESLVSFVEIQMDGQLRSGFQFNENFDPEKRIAELYSYHMRHGRLDLENQDSIFIQDLYKFYLRYALELLSKYFHRAPSSFGKWVFLCDKVALFLPGGSLQEAEDRIKKMKTRSRKRLNTIEEEEVKPTVVNKRRRRNT